MADIYLWGSTPLQTLRSVASPIVRKLGGDRPTGDEAVRTKAQVLYLATAHAPPSERALGPTATYLLAQRPCRIVIETGGGRDAHPVESADLLRPRPQPALAGAATADRIPG